LQHFNIALFHILLSLLWYNNITIQAEQWRKGKVSSAIYILVVEPDDGRNCRPKNVAYVINIFIAQTVHSVNKDKLQNCCVTNLYKYLHYGTSETEVYVYKYRCK